MSDTLPRYEPGQALPITVGSGGITGGTLIRADGTAAGNADTTVIGVANRDGLQGDVVFARRGTVEIGIASGSIVVGDPLCAAGSNKIRTWVAGTDAVAARIGRALSGAANNAAVTYALIGV